MSKLAECIGCGCDDTHACLDYGNTEPCHWIKVNIATKKGICSSCEGLLPKTGMCILEIVCIKDDVFMPAGGIEAITVSTWTDYKQHFIDLQKELEQSNTDLIGTKDQVNFELYDHNLNVVDTLKVTKDAAILFLNQVIKCLGAIDAVEQAMS